MSAIMVGVFPDYSAAERVRNALFREGFPTDRIELPACCDPGRAALGPGQALHDKLVQYFRTLFCDGEEESLAAQLVQRLEDGGATITVQPRGPVETEAARQILEHGRPVEVACHDLTNQRLEHAAARGASPWIRAFWFESHSDAHCIYCRLFERDLN